MRLFSGLLAFFFLASAVPVPAHSAPTATPIQHVIVIIGENRTFDNLFATYIPPGNQFAWNLLSEGIVKKDGSPGPNASLALQFEASDTAAYANLPQKLEPFPYLPQPNTTYGHGLPKNVADARFPATLPPLPFQITRHAAFSSHTGDPVHRFFQMWQQYDGGREDLFPWVAVTVGIGNANGETPLHPPAPFTDETTDQGGVSMGFYNMAQGDVHYFKYLAEHFAISDNYHQPVMGGTGANHVMLGTGDVAVYNLNGKPAPPPAGEIENPNPQAGGFVSKSGIREGNYYSDDGYGNQQTGMGGSYVECADSTQPGVAPIVHYLKSLPYPVLNKGVQANCEKGAYYLVNNYNPGYDALGHLSGVTQRPVSGEGAAMPSLAMHSFWVPPQKFRTIADALSAKGISWAYYGQDFRNGHPGSSYCPICDPFQYASSVMTTSLRKNLQGYRQFVRAVKKGTLPAVSFLKPASENDGHPGYSTPGRFERFVKRVVRLVRSHPKIWKNTAIFITEDEGGGYYDSGYMQPLDFFGDGTRIPLILVSPYARKGFVDHTYYDHVSILKFIERNWELKPLSKRSRDNLANPVMRRFALKNYGPGESLTLKRLNEVRRFYIPENRPAIGDLMNLFDFK